MAATAEEQTQPGSPDEPVSPPPGGEPAVEPAPGAPDEPGPQGPPLPGPSEGETGGEGAPEDALGMVMVINCPQCGTAITLAPDVSGFVPQQSPHYTTCPECQGFGEVATGSLVQEHAVTECPTCGGNGFVSTETGRGVQAPPDMQAPWQGAQWDAERGIWV